MLPTTQCFVDTTICVDTTAVTPLGVCVAQSLVLKIMPGYAWLSYQRTGPRTLPSYPTTHHNLPVLHHLLLCA